MIGCNHVLNQPFLAHAPPIQLKPVSNSFVKALENGKAVDIVTSSAYWLDPLHGYRDITSSLIPSIDFVTSSAYWLDPLHGYRDVTSLLTPYMDFVTSPAY